MFFCSQRILFLGAHTDDIEHGAGGSLAKALGLGCFVRYVSFSRCLDLPRNATIVDDQEAVSKHLESMGCSVKMLDLRNQDLASDSRLIRSELGALRSEFEPQVVFCHWPRDAHQDHREVTKECIRIFPGSTILGYEVLRSCHGFAPDVFVALSEDEVEAKITMISLYKTQADLYYNRPDVLRSLAVLRGASIDRPLAEGFRAIRVVV